MSGRSLPLDVARVALSVVALVVALVVAMPVAGGCKRAPQPEADPAEVAALADRMVGNSPVLAAVPACSDVDIRSATAMTFRTLRLVAGHTLDRTTQETADWVNPSALDAAPAVTLLDATANVTAKRRAAATLLTASSWVIFRVDLVNAPMALGVKELKTGTITGRVIHYDRQSSRPTCVTPWGVQNSRDKTQWAISISNKPYIDPAVVQVLREDLAANYVAEMRAIAAPPSR